ncbi:hypothetical protein [Leifsonia sp. A12D58]|uniref:hypothetical protein n=1 Tax=Leifsonia sp. A12D58 TaxID=3397674 RepID=UPI0039E19D3E
MADAGGYAYRARVLNPPVSGLLFANTKRVIMTDVIDATASLTPFLFGSLSAMGRRVRNVQLVVITLPRPVPNMVLISSTDGVLSKAGIALNEGQRLALEGDFDATFSLYCPRGYEADALYVFTPDVMSHLVDSASGCDIELVDNRVLIYAPAAAFATTTALSVVPELVQFLERKLNKQTIHYQDARDGGTSMSDPFRRAQITAMGGTDATFRIGSRGRRLRRRTTIGQKAGICAGALVAATAGAYWVVAVLRAFMP